LNAGESYGDGAVESDRDLEFESCEVQSCETAIAV